MRYPSLSPGRTGGGSDDEDERDRSSASGSDPDPADEFGQELGGDPVDSGGGGSAPEPDPEPDPSPDPSDEFGPELGGDPAESGGGNTGADPSPAPAPTPEPEPEPSPTPDPTPDPEPSPTSRAGTDVDVPAGASDGGPLGERITSNLDELGEIYTDRVADPVGDFSAATNPVARVEQRLFGTNAVGEVSEGVGEGVAQIGNVPGNTAAGIDAAQALSGARARSRDQVVIGGVPTGVFVPNPEGQRENAQAAGTVAASAAASASASPFETTGQLLGGAVGGAVVGGPVLRSLRGTPDVDSGGSSSVVRTGRSNVGTGGVDNILDADTVDAIRGTSGPSRRSRLRGEASRRLDDLDELLPGGSDRGQLQVGGQGRGTGRGRGGGETPDAPREFDGDDRVSDNLVQQSLNRQQRAERGAVERGDFEQSADPFGPGTRRGTITEGGDVELTRSTGGVASEPGGATATGATSRFSSTAAGAGAGLGSMSQTTDPTGIAPGEQRFEGGAAGADFVDPTSLATTAATSPLGEINPANDPSGIVPTNLGAFGEQRLGGGTLPGDATSGGSDTDVLDGSDPTNIAPPSSETDTGAETDTFAPTDTGSGTDQPPASDTDQPPASDTDQPPLTDTPAPPVTGTPPVTDTPLGTDTPPGTGTPPGRFIPPGLFGGGTPPRPRIERDDPEPDEPRRRRPEPQDDFGTFGRVDAGGPASSYFSETLTALALGGFAGDRAPAEGSEGVFIGGPPTRAAADAEGDDAEAVENVSALLFGAPLFGAAASEENSESGFSLL